MNVKPTGHFVLVKGREVEEYSKGGVLLIPESQKKREEDGNDIGVVVAFGPTAYKGFAGCECPEDWGVTVGDTVEYRRYDGKRLSSKEENYRLINDSDIIAVIEE